MKKKLSAGLLVCLMVAIAIVGSQARQANAAYSYSYNFQQTTKPFTQHASPGAAAYLSRAMGDCNCDPRLLNFYARLASSSINTLPPAPGTLPVEGQATWMAAKLPDDSSAGIGELDSVSITWSARVDPATSGKANCTNCAAIAYAGVAAPKQAKDFSAILRATPMNATWASYKFTTVVKPGPTNSIYVALGWNGTNSAIDVDCVTVTVVPIEK